MRERLTSVVEKLLILGVILWAANCLFDPFEPKAISTPFVGWS